MSTRMYDALTSNKNFYGIGDLNTKWAKHVTNGAIAQENMDNYTLAEITGYDTDGNLMCKQLSNIANEAFLVTTIEEEQLLNINDYQETYVDFYNAKGEMVRLTRLETGVRFDISSFELNAGVSTMNCGFLAHFDPTKKKYIISDVATPHADYSKSSKKFKVVDVDSDFGYGFGIRTIKLETI